MYSKILVLFIITINLNLAIFALENPDNKRVEYFVNEYINEKRNHFQLSIIRSGLYRPTIITVFEKEGLPADLSWLPLVESGFNCAAKSKASAAGCWQFIKLTGDAYGLKKGTWKDQRYDFNKSTVSAAKYLKRLYKMFGDWDLSLAAYNWGSGNVRSAIKKSRKKDYWSLDLPNETKNYIPRFYAVLEITRDLNKYGFNNTSDGIKTVKLRTGSHNLRYIANTILMVDYGVFIRLNPGYDIGYTPPGESTVIYLKKDWDISLLRGFGFLAKKKTLSY